MRYRKDTTCLCLDGCYRSGIFAWNCPDPQEGPFASFHGLSNCCEAAIAMINHHYDGNITQDEVSNRAFGDRCPGPEGDLNHGWCMEEEQITDALDWALLAGGAGHVGTEPSEADYKTYLGSNRPVLWAGTIGSAGHAVVISGYLYKDKTFYYKMCNFSLTEPSPYVPRGTYGCADCWIPANYSVGRDQNMWINDDADGDGVSSFDELYRWEDPFDLWSTDDDRDNDGLKDGKDIEGYLFEGYEDGGYVGGPSDPDGKDGRCEVDPDSDNGGVLDGDEDANKDGDVDDGETDPYSVTGDSANDDIPNVNITLAPSREVQQGGEQRTLVKPGTITATFKFLRKAPALTALNVAVGPLARYTPNGGTPTNVTLSPVGGVPPTDEWTGQLTIIQTTENGKAVFTLDNGNISINIIDGDEFWIDTRKAAGKDPGKD